MRVSDCVSEGIASFVSGTCFASFVGNNRHDPGWRAEIFQVQPPHAPNEQEEDGMFGMKRIVAFDGAAEYDRNIASALGKESSIGQLQAAELAITSHNKAKIQKSVNDNGNNGNNNSKGVTDSTASGMQNELSLTLCCLSNKGFVTTHVSDMSLCC